MLALLTELAQAIDGLLVLSETDAPLRLFVWPEPLPFTPAAILAAQNLPAETVVEQRELAAFFASRARLRAGQTSEEQASAVRFQQLQSLLEKHLTELHVLRIGTIEITVWIAGKTADGRIVGLTTLLAET
jgi:hypothetical protein